MVRGDPGDGKGRIASFKPLSTDAPSWRSRGRPVISRDRPGASRSLGVPTTRRDEKVADRAWHTPSRADHGAIVDPGRGRNAFDQARRGDWPHVAVDLLETDCSLL